MVTEAAPFDWEIGCAFGWSGRGSEVCNSNSNMSNNASIGLCGIVLQAFEGREDIGRRREGRSLAPVTRGRLVKIVRGPTQEYSCMRTDIYTETNADLSIYLRQYIHLYIYPEDMHVETDRHKFLSVYMQVRIMNFHWVGHSFNKPAGEEALVVVSSSDFARVSLTL